MKFATSYLFFINQKNKYFSAVEHFVVEYVLTQLNTEESINFL
jgi:hypothetical protein